MTTAFSCKAQSIIVPIGSGQDLEKNPNYYKKDVNNEFDKFVGEWKYQNGNTSLTFRLKKEEHYQTSDNSNYVDLLVGEYQYIENGVEKANTLNDFDDASITGYEHKIAGSVFVRHLPNYCTDNSTPQEIKIELSIEDPNDRFIEGSIFLRYVNDNGTEKLEVCIQNTTTMGDNPNPFLPMPNGFYVMIKQ